MAAALPRPDGMEGHQTHELVFLKRQLRRVKSAFSKARGLSEAGRTTLLYHVEEIDLLLRGTDEPDDNQNSRLPAGSVSKRTKGSESCEDMKLVVAKRPSSQEKDMTQNIGFIAAQTFALERLQQPPSKRFDGNPREFERWFRPLCGQIEKWQIDPADALEILKIHSTGEPNELLNDVAIFGLHGPLEEQSRRFHEITRTMRRTFFPQHVAEELVLEKLRNLPVIKDPELVYEDALQLRKMWSVCDSAMCMFGEGYAAIRPMKVTYVTDHLRKKLPTFLDREWRTLKYEYRRVNDSNPPFKMFCEFLKERAIMLINDWPAPATHHQEVSRAAKRKLKKAQKRKERASRKVRMYCPLHDSEHHDIKWCKKFKVKDRAEQRAFAAEHRLCEVCLERKHQGDCTPPTDIARSHSASNRRVRGTSPLRGSTKEEGRKVVESIYHENREIPLPLRNSNHHRNWSRLEPLAHLSQKVVEAFEPLARLIQQLIEVFRASGF